MRAAGLGRGDACVTNRCPPARVDMQCRLPLLVEGVALAGDQAWLSPEADGDWRVEFRCRCPRTTMAHDDDLGCPPRRGLPHPVPAGTTVHLPARVRITLVRETNHQLCVREARYPRSSSAARARPAPKRATARAGEAGASSCVWRNAGRTARTVRRPRSYRGRVRRRWWAPRLASRVGGDPDDRRTGQFSLLGEDRICRPSHGGNQESMATFV